MNVLSKIKIIYSERIPSFLLFVSKKLQTVQTIVIIQGFKNGNQVFDMRSDLVSDPLLNQN